MALIQNPVEHVPTLPAGKADPQVGGVALSVDLHTSRTKALSLQRPLDDGGVLQIEVCQLPHLLNSLRVQGSKTTCLGDVGGSVEEGIDDAGPGCLDGSAVGKFQFLGHNRPAKADTGKAGGLGEGVYLYGTFPGTLHLEDGLGQGFIPDKGRVGCIKDDDAAILPGKVHQLLKLGFGGHRTSGIVGGAKVDEAA